MRDQFVVLVDSLFTEYTLENLLTESTPEAAIERARNRFDRSGPGPESVSESKSSFSLSQNHNQEDCGSLVECRICHDEDLDSNMEVPCSCSGSLKFAHRKCVQRWCNAKGNTNCEICLEQFEPNYTAPPPLFQYGGTPMNFRGNWEISRRDQNNPGFVRMIATTGRRFPNSGYDDHSNPSRRTMVYYWFVTLILILLLVLRHALPMIISGKAAFSLTIFVIVLMRIIGLLVPIYAIAYALSMLNRLPCARRQRQAPILPIRISDSDNETGDDDDDADDGLDFS